MREKISKKPLQQGFSLLEVLIAIVIFTAGVIAVMYLFPLGARDIGKARDLTAATYLGQAKMEETLLLPAVAASEETGTFAPSYPGLYYTVTRSKFKNKSTLIQISVEVYKKTGPDSKKVLVRYDTLKGVGGSFENN